MAKYSAIMNRATTSTTNAAGAIYNPSSGMRRFRVWQLIIGSTASPADNDFLVRAAKSTTAPTGGTAVTPEPLDNADAATPILCMDGTITNGTVGNAVLEIALNQRATVIWSAHPGCELVAPAVADDGFHFTTPTALNTPAIDMTAFFED